MNFRPFPQRIVSLVPSQTELLFDLGLDDRVVGVTKFCVHPAHCRSTRKIIGGTKNFDLAAIAQLQPDLILGNKEENYQEGIEYLQQTFPVYVSDIFDLGDALEMIRTVGDLTSTTAKAERLLDEIRQAFQTIATQPPRRVLYFIWRDPWMVAGSQTFINAMLGQTGLVNVASDRLRYPVLTATEIQAFNPDLILLSSEPYPFKEKHVHELQNMCPRADIRLVDGEMFSWYGSRLRLAPAYFNTLKF